MARKYMTRKISCGSIVLFVETVDELDAIVSRLKVLFDVNIVVLFTTKVAAILLSLNGRATTPFEI
jgi:hypothetical protein